MYLLELFINLHKVVEELQIRLGIEFIRVVKEIVLKFINGIVGHAGTHVE